MTVPFLFFCRCTPFTLTGQFRCSACLFASLHSFYFFQSQLQSITLTMMSQAVIDALVEKAVTKRLQELGAYSPFQRNDRPFKVYRDGESSQLRRSNSTASDLSCSSSAAASSQFSHSSLDEAATQQLRFASNSASSQSSNLPIENISQQLRRSNSASSSQSRHLPIENISQQLSRSNSATASSQSSHLPTETIAESPFMDDDDHSGEDLCIEDFADCYDSIVPIYKGSKKKLYQTKDKNVVRVPIMEMLDPLYLAPFKSPIFRRHAKQRHPNSLKKHADLVFEEFQRLIKPVIRRLCAQTSSTDRFLDQRYFWCAYDLIRKRRANHVQSWRTRERPSNFCYGGQKIYEATYGKLKPLPQKQKKKRRRRATRGGPENKRATRGSPENKRQAQRHESRDECRTPPELSRQEAHQRHESRDECRSPPDINRHDASDISDMLTSLDDDNSEPEFDPFSDQLCDELLYATTSCKSCGCQFDYNNSFCMKGAGADQQYCDQCTTATCKCVDCGKMLTPVEVFPKTNMTWHDGFKNKSWCQTCYSKFIREKMLPNVNNHMAKEQQRKNKNKRGAKSSADDSSKKKRKKKPCKHCGAATHQTSRSKLCPHNKKYQSKPVADAIVTAPAKVIMHTHTRNIRSSNTYTYTHLTHTRFNTGYGYSESVRRQVASYNRR